ncbi:PREDICTED: uncharacterized protein LOC105575592 [Cercocebus atys]|uniref:uncharacterized protein LOC105575592 n=1 Tax=Cercocebus atys TaxID=9531 RepID=UPI0005F3D552|nr:PREDICTED: uncharacterized protein LOC105575592 [Cercocebus atys]
MYCISRKFLPAPRIPRRNSAGPSPVRFPAVQSENHGGKVGPGSGSMQRPGGEAAWGGPRWGGRLCGGPGGEAACVGGPRWGGRLCGGPGGEAACGGSQQRAEELGLCFLGYSENTGEDLETACHRRGRRSGIRTPVIAGPTRRRRLPRVAICLSETLWQRDPADDSGAVHTLKPAWSQNTTGEPPRQTQPRQSSMVAPAVAGTLPTPCQPLPAGLQARPGP